MLPRTTHAAHLNCRRRRLPLTDGPHRAKTIGCTRVLDHYSVTTEGPRRLNTSAPTSPTTRAVAPSEKARPLRMTAATTATI
jgi:hypothetical protein